MKNIRYMIVKLVTAVSHSYINGKLQGLQLASFSSMSSIADTCR